MSFAAGSSSSRNNKNKNILLPRPKNLCYGSNKEGLSAKLDILNFSPHLRDDAPFSILPAEVVHQRVDLVANYTNGIRTFACYNGDEAIRYAKRNLQMFTAAGCWIEKNVSKSMEELNCLIKLAQEGVVDLAIVGSEVISWQDFTAGEIVEYIELFRAAVPNVPVTFGEKFETLVLPGNLATVADAVDLLYVNYYPFWSGHPIGDASFVMETEHRAMVENVRDTGKEVWVSEIGWPSDGDCSNGHAKPSVDNQQRYLNESLHWALQQGTILTWFDAFDQPWRNGSEWCGVAGQWGLFDADGVIKPGPEQIFSQPSLFRPCEIHVTAKPELTMAPTIVRGDGANALGELGQSCAVSTLFQLWGLMNLTVILITGITAFVG